MGNAASAGMFLGFHVQGATGLDLQLMVATGMPLI